MQALWLADAGGFLRYHDNPGGLPARLYVHGLGCAGSSDWPHVVGVPPLAGRRSLLVDLLGYGFSDRPLGFSYTMEAQADTLAALLDHCSLGGVEVIGHSMGGSIAILLASRRPDLVSRLVVAEPNLDPGPGFVSGRIAASSEDSFIATGHRDLVALFEQAARKGEAPPGSYAASLRLASPHALHRSAVSLIAGRDPTYRTLLRSLPIPRAYLYGARSTEDTTGLAESGVAIHRVADAGHGLMEDNPRGFAEAVASCPCD